MNSTRERRGEGRGLAAPLSHDSTDTLERSLDLGTGPRRAALRALRSLTPEERQVMRERYPDVDADAEVRT